MKADSRQGFTLGELLVVVLIIGILAAIAIPRLRYARDSAYQNSILADLKNLSTLQETFHVENFTYSLDLDDLGMSPSRAVTIEINEADVRGWGATASHSAVDSGTCGVFYGTASAASGAPATTPGVITCDFGG